MRTITFDLDTGKVVERSGPPGVSLGMTGEQSARIAAECLPGTTPELLDEWYSAWMGHDDPAATGSLQWVPDAPAGWAVGARVKHREAPTLSGTITDMRSTLGELHTVWVRWDDELTQAPYGPRELELV